MVSLELPWFGEMIGSRQGVLMNVVSALIKETEPGSGPSRGTGFAAALVLERVSVIRHNPKENCEAALGKRGTCCSKPAPEPCTTPLTVSACSCHLTFTPPVHARVTMAWLPRLCTPLDHWNHRVSSSHTPHLTQVISEPEVQRNQFCLEQGRLGLRG